MSEMQPHQPTEPEPPMEVGTVSNPIEIGAIEFPPDTPPREGYADQWAETEADEPQLPDYLDNARYRLWLMENQMSVPGPEESADAYSAVPPGSVDTPQTPLSDAEPSPAEDFRPPVFMAEVTAFNSGVGAFWKEKTLSGQAFVDFTSGRACTASSTGVGFGSTEKQFVCVEQLDLDEYRYTMNAADVLHVYLTQNGGASGNYSYDVYLDAAKTMKLASTLFPVWTTAGTSAATKGLARLSGKTAVLEVAYEPVGGGGSSKILAMIAPTSNSSGFFLSDVPLPSTGNMVRYRASGNAVVTSLSIGVPISFTLTAGTASFVGTIYGTGAHTIPSSKPCPKTSPTFDSAAS